MVKIFDIDHINVIEYVGISVKTENKLMTGAELLVKALEKENTEYVFGYPGVSICPFYDALTKSEIKGVLMRHEANCAHAANGYARSYGKVGVCAVSSGPGATNLITGIATAFADSIPLVCITGQVKSEHIGTDMFQEADITGASESFVKYSYLVKNASDIPRVIKEAFYIASTGRKGPVLVDIPVDVLLNEGGDFNYPETVNLRTYKPTVKGHAVQIKKVITQLKKATRPIICAGGGVISADAVDELRTFAHKYNIPVVTTMMGLGIMNSDDELYMGMVGNNGKKYANKAMNESDVLIMVGARVADRAVKQPDLITNNKKLIHIDVDPAEIGKNAGPSIPIVGDAKNILEDLNAFEDEMDFTPWLMSLLKYKQTREEKLESTSKYVNPNELVRDLSGKLDSSYVYVSDIGQNQIYSCQNFIIKDNKFLTSGGMGCMGYSLPAAIGASMHDKNVIVVMGDGAFQMNMNELSSLKALDGKIKIIVMNNHSLGMIKEYQHISYQNNYTMEELGIYPKLKHIAKAYDIKYMLMENMDKEEDMINEFLKADESVIMEVMVDPDAFTAS